MFESNIDIDPRAIFSDTDAITPAPKGFGSGFAGTPQSKIFSLPAFSGKVYPRSDWDELMDLQDKNRTSPLDTHKAHVPIVSQESTNHCWSYGTVCAVDTAYAQAGMDGLDLSATSVACLAKDYNNVGGWGIDAVRQIEKTGIADASHWPRNSFSRSHYAKETTKANMGRHNVVGFENLGESFDQMMSALLCPVMARPCTLGVMWWGHLICALKAVKVDGQYGVLIANSWGPSWGDQGYSILLGSKARPDESIVVKAIKPRSEK